MDSDRQMKEAAAARDTAPAATEPAELADGSALPDGDERADSAQRHEREGSEMMITALGRVQQEED